MSEAHAQEKIDLLKNVELFSTMSTNELEVLAYHCHMIRRERGSLIFTEGSPGDELYVIKEGEVMISRRSGNDDVDIAQFISGESFGEWDLLAGTPRAAAAVAIKDTMLLIFPREGITFSMFLQKYPKMSARMLYKLQTIIAQRLRTTQRLINERTPWVQNLKKQMHVDKLTGLYNKNFLLDEADGVLHASGTGALLIIKPDNFKDINDRYGHEAGDKALILMSIFTQSAIGAADLAIRYTGDEFAVLMPGATRNEAIAAARDMGIIIKGINLEGITGDPSLRITVSIGIALFPIHGTEMARLASGAYEKMLKARGLGGNRIIVIPEK